MFGFGGSTSKQSSSSYGESQSTDQSLSLGISQGSSEQGSKSTQDIAFEDVFAKLFGGGAETALGLDTSSLTTTANTLFSGGMDFISGLGGGAGAEYMQGRLSGDNAVLEEQIGLLGEDLGRFFEEELLTGITSESVAGGQLGGGRQGVAQGIAASQVAGEFQRGATALRAQDIQQRDQVAGNLESLGIQAAGTGLQNLPMLQQLAQSGATADMIPYLMLAQITGDPTVLTQAESYGTSADFATDYSSSFGQSTSMSESESSGSSKSISMGF